ALDRAAAAPRRDRLLAEVVGALGRALALPQLRGVVVAADVVVLVTGVGAVLLAPLLPPVLGGLHVVRRLVDVGDRPPRAVLLAPGLLFLLVLHVQLDRLLEVAVELGHERGVVQRL